MNLVNMADTRFTQTRVKTKKNGDKSDDTQNNPVVTSDTLFAELEKDIITSFSEVGVSPVIRR